MSKVNTYIKSVSFIVHEKLDRIENLNTKKPIISNFEDNSLFVRYKSGQTWLLEINFNFLNFKSQSTRMNKKYSKDERGSVHLHTAEITETGVYKLGAYIRALIRDNEYACSANNFGEFIDTVFSWLHHNFDMNPRDLANIRASLETDMFLIGSQVLVSACCEGYDLKISKDLSELDERFKDEEIEHTTYMQRVSVEFDSIFNLSNGGLLFIAKLEDGTAPVGYACSKRVSYKTQLIRPGSVPNSVVNEEFDMLISLVVEPQFQKTGIGRKLLQSIAASASGDFRAYIPFTDNYSYLFEFFTKCDFQPQVLKKCEPFYDDKIHMTVFTKPY